MVLLPMRTGKRATTITPQSEILLNPAHGHWINQSVELDADINYLELVPIWLALVRCAEVWRNQHVLCMSDNTQVVAMLRKGHSISKKCMVLLRRIFWICAKFNIYITSKHVPGRLNVMPDLLSRIGFTYELSDLAKYDICCSGRVRAGCSRIKCSGSSVVI